LRKRLDGVVEHDGVILCQKTLPEVTMQRAFGKALRQDRDDLSTVPSHA
jgi:hypothetical protein